MVQIESKLKEFQQIPPPFFFAFTVKSMLARQVLLTLCVSV